MREPFILREKVFPRGVISVPCRYVHTPGEMIDLTDAENACRLLNAF